MKQSIALFKNLIIFFFGFIFAHRRIIKYKIGTLMMQPLKVHYFQHIAGEGFGSCFEYLKSLGAQISATEFFALPGDLLLDIEALPSVDDVDLLIIMGGAMSVNDEANYSWLKVEKRWIRRYLSKGKPAIGLCLGGQLIANALGANVSRNAYQELGWGSVYKTSDENSNYFSVPAELTVMQWHSETFEIPKGAKLLATNQICQNQMYQIGANVLGFQFHPEITPRVLSLYIENEEHEQEFKGPHVQPMEMLKKSKNELFQSGNDLLISAINYVLGIQQQTKKIAVNGY